MNALHELYRSTEKSKPDCPCGILGHFLAVFEQRRASNRYTGTELPNLIFIGGGDSIACVTSVDVVVRRISNGIDRWLNI